METPKEKIQKIVDDLGMSPEIQAKAMKVSVQTIYQKRNDKIKRDSFNEKNYLNLLNYIKETIAKF